MKVFRWLFSWWQRRSDDTRISPAHLPTELHYIVPLAERHGSDARVVPFDARLGRHVPYAEKLSARAIASLRALYIEIRAKDHGPLINRWYHDSGEGPCPPGTRWPIYGLLCLFGQLAELGIAPFNDRTVRPMNVHVELDWTKLPDSLRYLAGPAEVYGEYQFEGAILDFLHSRMTPEERDELQALARQYERDGEAIERWLEEFPITQHREAALVYFTGNLLAMGADAGLL